MGLLGVLAGGGAKQFEFSWDAGGGQENQNLRGMANARGYRGQRRVIINLYGNYGSRNVGLAALYGGDWPAGTVVVLRNYGSIMGAGGQGGPYHINIPAPNGGNGGPAFQANSGALYLLYNYGSIVGGGGGGGSGETFGYTAKAGEYGGGPGGQGQGYGQGRTNGQPNIYGRSYGGWGGNGGDWGQPGGNGSISSYSKGYGIGYGGQPGASIQNSGAVQIQVGGDIRGPVQ